MTCNLWHSLGLRNPVRRYCELRPRYRYRLYYKQDTSSRNRCIHSPVKTRCKGFSPILNMLVIINVWLVFGYKQHADERFALTACVYVYVCVRACACVCVCALPVGLPVCLSVHLWMCIDLCVRVRVCACVPTQKRIRRDGKCNWNGRHNTQIVSSRIAKKRTCKILVFS